MEAMGGLVAGEFWLFSAPCQVRHLSFLLLSLPLPFSSNFAALMRRLLGSCASATLTATKLILCKAANIQANIPIIQINTRSTPAQIPKSSVQHRSQRKGSDGC